MFRPAMTVCLARRSPDQRRLKSFLHATYTTSLKGTVCGVAVLVMGRIALRRQRPRPSLRLRRPNVVRAVLSRGLSVAAAGGKDSGPRLPRRLRRGVG